MIEIYHHNSFTLNKINEVSTKLYLRKIQGEKMFLELFKSLESHFKLFSRILIKIKQIQLQIFFEMNERFQREEYVKVLHEKQILVR